MAELYGHLLVLKTDRLGSVIMGRSTASFKAIRGVLLVAITLGACTTVPITGRSQLNMFSDQQLVSSADQHFSEFMKQNERLSSSESPQAAAMITSVNRVSQRIIDAAGLHGRYQWETVVVKSSKANALVMPNGKIVVFSGLLPVTKTDAGLAAVIGHEVGHVVARHTAERMSQALIARTALETANIAIAISQPRYRPAIGAALGLGAQYGVLLPFSRQHESEADLLGLFYMAKAGYEPSEAIGLWQRMEAAGGSGPWEYLSTHPSPATRRSQLSDWLPEAKLYYTDTSRPLPSSLEEVRTVRTSAVVSSPATKIDWQPPPKINCPRTTVWTGYGCSSSKLGFDIGPDFRVINIEKGGPAEQAGVLDGDVMIAIDDTRAQSIALIHMLFLTKNAGDKVKLTLDRGGSLLTVEPQFVPRVVAAQDTRSILWTATTFSDDAGKRLIRWHMVRVFPTETDCLAEGRAQVREYHIRHLAKARVAWGPGWGDLRIVNDGLVVNVVRETSDRAGR